MPIDTSEVGSDGWMLDRLYHKLRKQQRHCESLHKRYRGDPPLPAMNPNQAEATKLFVKKARTNFERLIVKAVLDRLKIRGIRTAADNDESGDAEAFETWKESRGALWSTEVAKHALTMGKGFVMVGKSEDTGKLLVTAEDPRMCAVLTDPADPLKVIAGLKLIFDDVGQQDIAYLFRREGDRVWMRKASRPRYFFSTSATTLRAFDSGAFDWMALAEAESFEPDWLQGTDELEALVPIVPFCNEDDMAEFEPHIELLDRITQQILQRMTIATIQAFKQRAMKGLPQTDPKTGEKIDYENIFLAEPGAIWNIPATVEIWESGEVNLQGILLSVRDDIKDLAAASGTPLYTVTPDVANGSAEGASLQREQVSAKVLHRQDLWDLPHARVAELIFRTNGDTKRAKEPEKIRPMWTPVERASISERSNAMAQTKGIMPTYLQLVEIWGMDPARATDAMKMLEEDAKRAQASAPQPGGGAPMPTQGSAGSQQSGDSGLPPLPDLSQQQGG